MLRSVFETLNLDDPNRFLLQALSDPLRSGWHPLEAVERGTGRTTRKLVEAADAIIKGEQVVMLVRDNNQADAAVRVLLGFLDRLDDESDYLGVGTTILEVIESRDDERVFFALPCPPGRLHTLARRLRGVEYTLLINDLG